MIWALLLLLGQAVGLLIWEHLRRRDAERALAVERHRVEAANAQAEAFQQVAQKWEAQVSAWVRERHEEERELPPDELLRREVANIWAYDGTDKGQVELSG